MTIHVEEGTTQLGSATGCAGEYGATLIGAYCGGMRLRLMRAAATFAASGQWEAVRR